MKPRSVTLAAILFCVPGAAPLHSEVMPPPPLGELAFAAVGTERDSGRFVGVDFDVTFAADDSGSEVSAHVGVGRVRLEAHLEVAQGLIWMDGGGASLRREERMAIYGLLDALSKAWRDDIKDGGLDRHRELLFRHLMYWSEAPVGLPLYRLEAKIGDDSGIRFEAFLSETTPSLPQPSAEACISFTTNCPDYRGGCVPTAFNTPCKKGSCATGKTCFRCDDKRTYLSGCSFTTVSGVCYDADSSNVCFACESVKIGCDKATGCVGRCGPGCNPSSCGADSGMDGEGTYTYDCAEHDRCCGRYGGCLSGNAAADCGDEYAEAYDDAVAGSCSCRGCYAT